MLIRVKNKPRNPNEPNHRVYDAPADDRPGFDGGFGHTVDGWLPEPVREPARGLRCARERSETADAGLRHQQRRGQDPVHLLRPRGRRQHCRLERAGRQGRRSDGPARHGGLQQARHSGRPGPGRDRGHADGHEQRRPHGYDARPCVPQRQRLPARHAEPHEHHDARERQRRGDAGALGERHEQQPAQPALRDPESGRGRLDPDARRLAELRVGRQLDGAAHDDRPDGPADEGGSAERRHGPRRHGPARGPAERVRRDGRARVDLSHQPRAHEQRREHRFADVADRSGRGRQRPREVRLPEVGGRGRPLRQRHTRPGLRTRTSSARRASSRRPSGTAAARTRPSSARRLRS